MQESESSSSVIAVKFDKNKPRYDLLPMDAIEQVVEIFTYGASKYSDRNWEQGMSWGRLVAAGFRHLSKWMCGIDRDAESGFSHIAHAIANFLMLLSYIIRKVGTDDRYKEAA